MDTFAVPDAALDDEGAGARASLWWRSTPAFGAERVGLIGGYAATDAQSGRRVLQSACRELARQACTFAIGPMDGSTWRRYRLVTERGPRPPFFLEPDNPDDWPRHFESEGFGAIARYRSAICEDLAAVRLRSDARGSSPGHGLRVRPFASERLEDELGLLWRLASDAFARNFLYTPVAEEEFRAGFRALLPALRPEIFLVAEDREGPVGFAFAVPDALQSARGQAIDTDVFKTLGIATRAQRRGLGHALFEATIDAARACGYRRMVFALFHERNPSARLAHTLGRDFRGYTLYGRRL